MYFEDENDQEEVHFRAQKNMKTKILNNRYRDIGNDEELKVGRDQENNIFGDRKELIDGHKTSETKQSFTEVIEQDVDVTYNANENSKVAQSQSLSIDENRMTKVGKDTSLDIGGKKILTILEGRLPALVRMTRFKWAATFTPMYKATFHFVLKAPLRLFLGMKSKFKWDTQDLS